MYVENTKMCTILHLVIKLNVNIFSLIKCFTLSLSHSLSLYIYMYTYVYVLYPLFLSPFTSVIVKQSQIEIREAECKLSAYEFSLSVSSSPTSLRSHLSERGQMEGAQLHLMVSLAKALMAAERVTGS